MSALYARAVFFVRDASAASRFYVDRLGFALDWNHEDVVLQVSLLGFELILNQVSDATRARAGAGRVFIGLDDAQVAPFVAHVREKAIPVRQVEWGRPTLVIDDPDGNELFLWLPGDDIAGVVTRD